MGTIVKGEKGKNNDKNFLKCSHQNAILWRGLFFLSAHTSFQAACGPPFIVLLNHYAMICSFSLSAISHRAPPVRRITSRLTMEISLRAFIVQFNPQPFVSLCVFYARTINLPIYWKDNYLFLLSKCLRFRQMWSIMRSYKSTRGRSNSAVSSDQQKLW